MPGRGICADKHSDHNRILYSIRNSQASHAPSSSCSARAFRKFVASLLARNIDMEEDICDQLFNHRENRLARVLLKLSRYGQHDFLDM